MRTAILAYRDGHLVAVEHDTDSLKPVRRTYYWPLGKAHQADVEGYLGKEVIYGGPPTYNYSLRNPDGISYTRFPLPEGGQTHALVIEEELVPAPRVRAGIETRWRDGRWEKYLKREGWVPA